MTRILPRLYAYRFAIAHLLNGVLLVLALIGGVSADFAGLSGLWPFPETWRAHALMLHGALAAGLVGVKRFWQSLKATLPDRDGDGRPDLVDEAPDDPTVPRATQDGAP